MALNIGEAHAVNTLIRRLLNPKAAADEDATREAALLLAASAYKTLMAGITPDSVTELWAGRTGQIAAEKRFGDAIDWLLNSRYMDPDALVAFWGVVDGHWTTHDADRGFIDGRSLHKVRAEIDDAE